MTGPMGDAENSSRLPSPPLRRMNWKEEKMTCLVDSYNRRLDYLRISLTDRCNFRCLYCMPPEGIPLLPKKDILSIEEIEKLVRIFVSLGVSRVRLTGGEPLLRKKIIGLVDSLSRVGGLTDINLTTNGSLLAPMAASLKEAGLTGVNISLDSLDRQRFKKIALYDGLDSVVSGLVQSLTVGLKVKINVVALADLAREEVKNFLLLASRYPVEVRFLEFMPLCGTGYRPDLVFPIQTLKDWIREDVSLVSIPRDRSVAKTYAIKGGAGRVGFIASMSEPFCGTCNRLRLTSVGGLRPCLFSPLETDLRSPLRNGVPDETLADLIRKTAWQKPRGHEEIVEKRKYAEMPKIRMLGG